MGKTLFKKSGKMISDSLNISDSVEVKIFQNKNNKQFNLPVLKRHTSPKILQDIFNNKNIIGLKFKITDVIFKDERRSNI